jgi:hypothetical protein
MAWPGMARHGCQWHTLVEAFYASVAFDRELPETGEVDRLAANSPDLAIVLDDKFHQSPFI